jgi:type IX secretion system PorP/SprF family membrane protein
MKKALFLILLCTIYLSVMAQSNIRLNHYWENPYYITPASINNQYIAIFSMASRKQWVNFEGAPVTLLATATTYIEDWHTQLGLKIFEDKIGYTSTTNASLSFAYAVTLNDTWRLHLGIAGSYQNLSFDISQIVLTTPEDIEAYRNLTPEKDFNSDFGVELASKSFRFGAASQNIVSLFDKKNKQQVNTNFLYAAYRSYTEDPIDFGIGTCGIQYSNMFQMECYASAYFKAGQTYDKFQIGAFYRTPSEMGIILGINFSKSLSLSYSYDYNTSAVKRSSIGTHELMLTYRINKGVECHSCF